MHCYKELWTNKTLENYWNTKNLDKKIIRVEELREALK